jgi:hypothetical protein
MRGGSHGHRDIMEIGIAKYGVVGSPIRLNGRMRSQETDAGSQRSRGIPPLVKAASLSEQQIDSLFDGVNPKKGKEGLS